MFNSKVANMKIEFCIKYIFLITILTMSTHVNAYSYFTLQNSFGRSNLIEVSSSKTTLPPPVVWKITQLPVHLNFDTADAPLLISGGWNAKAELALTQWNDVIKTLTWSVENTVQGLQACNGLPSAGVVISAQWGKDFCGTPWGEDVLALTQLTYQINSSSQGETAEIVSANLMVNNTLSWSVYQGPLHYFPNGETEHDFQRVFLHETGHVAGLTHPDENGQVVDALMNSREGDIDAPTADDINGIDSLYPARGISNIATAESKKGGGSIDGGFLILFLVLILRRFYSKSLITNY